MVHERFDCAQALCLDNQLEYGHPLILVLLHDVKELSETAFFQEARPPVVGAGLRTMYQTKKSDIGEDRYARRQRERTAESVAHLKLSGEVLHIVCARARFQSVQNLTEVNKEEDTRRVR